MDIKNVKNGARTRNLQIFKDCIQNCEVWSEINDVAHSQPSDGDQPRSGFTTRRLSLRPAFEISNASRSPCSARSSFAQVTLPRPRHLAALFEERTVYPFGTRSVGSKVLAYKMATRSSGNFTPFSTLSLTTFSL